MRRLWITLGIVVVFEFAVLGWIGTRIYQEMPPIPERVVTTDGQEVVGPGEIMRGQQVWQTMGGKRGTGDGEVEAARRAAA